MVTLLFDLQKRDFLEIFEGVPDRKKILRCLKNHYTWEAPVFRWERGMVYVMDKSGAKMSMARFRISEHEPV